MLLVAISGCTSPPMELPTFTRFPTSTPTPILTSTGVPTKVPTATPIPAAKSQAVWGDPGTPIPASGQDWQTAECNPDRLSSEMKTANTVLSAKAFT